MTGSLHSRKGVWLVSAFIHSSVPLSKYHAKRQVDNAGVDPEAACVIPGKHQQHQQHLPSLCNHCLQDKPMLKVGRVKWTSIHSSLTQTQRCGCNSRLIRCNSSNKRITSSVEAFSSCQVLHKRPWSTRCWADNKLNMQSFCQQGACN